MEHRRCRWVTTSESAASVVWSDDGRGGDGGFDLAGHGEPGECLPGCEQEDAAGRCGGDRQVRGAASPLHWTRQSASRRGVGWGPVRGPMLVSGYPFMAPTRAARSVSVRTAWIFAWGFNLRRIVSKCSSPLDEERCSYSSRNLFHESHAASTCP